MQWTWWREYLNNRLKKGKAIRFIANEVKKWNWSKANMLHLQFFFIVFFCLVDDRISSERDQLCQLTMIQECLDHSLGLLEAIESGNDHLLIKECDSLQVRLGLWPISSTLKNIHFIWVWMHLARKYLQSTPDNSNLQGKSKNVRVIGSSKKIASSKEKNSFSYAQWTF